MKLILIYNSSCQSCLSYIDYVKFCASKIGIDIACYDVNIDIFDSIHHIVNCRLTIDRHINQLPLVIFYDSSGPKHAIVGIHGEDEFVAKLKTIFL